MIDIHEETLVAIPEVPRLLPRRNGRTIHRSAIYRWILRGCRGVVLESIKVGGLTYTSLEALQRFCEELNSTNPGFKKSTGGIARERQRHRVTEQLKTRLV